MSRSYRHSHDAGNSNTGRDRQNKRRSNRRERRLITELASQADSFVSPLLSGLSSNAGFASERQFSNPAVSASRS